MISRRVRPWTTFWDCLHSNLPDIKCGIHLEKPVLNDVSVHLFISSLSYLRKLHLWWLLMITAVFCDLWKLLANVRLSPDENGRRSMDVKDFHTHIIPWEKIGLANKNTESSRSTKRKFVGYLIEQCNQWHTHLNYNHKMNELVSWFECFKPHHSRAPCC